MLGETGSEKLWVTKCLGHRQLGNSVSETLKNSRLNSQELFTDDDLDYVLNALTPPQVRYGSAQRLWPEEFVQGRVGEEGFSFSHVVDAPVV